MSTLTPNLNLEKPADNEYIDIDVINDNYDIIDTAVAAQDVVKVTSGSGNAASVGQLQFKDSVWKGLDEIRLYNGTDPLYCKEGVTTGLLMQNNQIKIVSVTWNNGVPAVGTMKGYIDANGDYHIYDSVTTANNTSIATLRDSVSLLDNSVARKVSATDMGVYFKTPAASGQVFQLSFNDRNVNSMLYGKVLTLTITETGMFLWNSTDSVRVW